MSRALLIILTAITDLALFPCSALAFATRRMTKMNLLVRVLGACETMANATCVRLSIFDPFPSCD